MAIPVAFAKLASMVATGAVGAAAYDGVRRALSSNQAHDAAVDTVAIVLKGVRKAEVAAESTRLAVADVIAEARERIGEQAPPPAEPAHHDHEH